MAGYYSGMLQGMQGLEEIERSKSTRRYNDTLTANAAEDQQIQRQRLPSLLATDEQSLVKGEQDIVGGEMENTLRALEVKQQDSLLRKQEYEANILRNMATAGDRSTTMEEQGSDFERLAEESRQIGRQLMQVDPVKAKTYFDAAAGYESKGMQAIKTSLDIKTKQLDTAGQLVVDVQNQEDWNAVIPELSKNGVAVPPQFRDWRNPATRDYITKLALKSETISKNYKDQIGLLDAVDAAAYDKQTKEILDVEQYDQSLRERLSVAGLKKDSLGKINAYEGLYANAFVTNANEFIVGAANLAAITQGFETAQTKGMFSELGGGGLLSSTQKYLSNRATPEDYQQYEAITSPIVRQAGLILNNGRPIVTKEQSEQIKKSIVVDAGQPRIVFLQKIGDMRTLYEKALESQLKAPYFKKAGTEEQKAQLEENLAAIRKAIPFTANQVARYSRDAKTNPNLSFRDWLKTNTKEEVIGYEQPNKERLGQFKVIR